MKVEEAKEIVADFLAIRANRFGDHWHRDVVLQAQSVIARAQLRDLVLAAVPPVGSGDWCVVSDFVDGYNEHAEETIANINALFGEENGNG